MDIVFLINIMHIFGGFSTQQLKTQNKPTWP